MENIFNDIKKDFDMFCEGTKIYKPSNRKHIKITKIENEYKVEVKRK